MWLNNFGIEAADGQYRPFSGDFNGDGKHDVAVYQPNAGRWFVAVNTGSSFSSAGALWLDGWAVEQQDNYWQNLVGDFNGDGKDDIAAYAPIIGRWVVAVSTGASFAPAPGPYAGGVWLDGFGVDGSSPGAYIGLVGRFAGSDSKADIGVYQPTQGRWWVAKTVGSSFVNQGLWLEGFGVENASQRWRPFVGDYAGTEITWDDIGVYAPVAGRWFVANNTHSSFQPVSGPYGGAWLDGWAVESYPGHYRTQ
jgi:hypothetical protein